MTSASQLTPLLPTTPYLLSYVLPLLLLSLFLTFAGTFFTLDRSRSFPPANGATTSGKGYSAVPGGLPFEKAKKKSSFNWYFEGGMGGLAAGYIFGIHLSTALSLIIPATTPSPPLSDKSFLAVWILSCIVTTPLAARYRYAALTFLGVTGGTLTALALCIITHPGLQSRVIVVSIFLPLFTVIVLLASTIPAPRVTAHFFRPFLRLCTASTGAFGVVLSIALLMNPQEEGWANPWERLWMDVGPPEGPPWGSGQEQGLSAAWAVFVAVGMVVDWALHRWIGECPDQKWDNYLAQYAAHLPNQADRAGTFQPLTSFWDKIFPSATPTAPFPKDIFFPSDADMKTKSPLPLPVTMHNMGSSPKLSKSNKNDGSAELTRVPTSVELLKKKRTSKAKHCGWKFTHVDGSDRKERKPIKFGELSDDSDSDSDNDLEDVKKAAIPASPAIEQKGLTRPWGLTSVHHSSAASSTPTLVGGSKGVSSDPRLDTLETLDYDQEIAQLKEKRKKAGGDDRDDLDYSDYEEDITAPKPGPGKVDNGGAGWSPAFLKRHQSQQGDQVQAQAISMPMPVPATPSLIKAIDRLAIAQKEAYGAATIASPVSPGPPLSPVTRNPNPVLNSTSAGVKSINTPSDRSKSKFPRRNSATLEDAEVGVVGKSQGMPPLSKAERAPRWEEFWREVRVKAQS